MMISNVDEREQQTNSNSVKWLIVLWAFLLLISLVVLRPIFINVQTYSGLIESIDERKDTVTGLIAASALVSTAISLIPDDAATPIATQIAETADYLILVLGVLYFEKYLLPILGGLSTVGLIPLGCILAIAYLIGIRTPKMKDTIRKILIAAIAVVLVIPIGIWVSNAIEELHHESITNTIDQVMTLGESIESEAAEDRNFWEQLADAADKAINGVTSTIEWAKNAMSRFIEAIMVLVIVNCVIPVITSLAFIGIIKALMKDSGGFEFDFKLSPPKAFSKMIQKKKTRQQQKKALPE